MDKLRCKILERINRENGIYSFYLCNGEGEVMLDIESDYKCHAASLIKVPIMLEVLRLWQDQMLDLNEVILLDEFEKVGGCGMMPFLKDGHPFTLLELVKLMICMSDNTATNTLIQRFGIEGVNQTLRKIGTEHTHLARKLMISGTGTYSTTCASDMGKVLLALSISGLLKDEAIQLGKEILLDQQYNDRLSALWLTCGECGHRLGTLNRCPQCGTDASDVDPKEFPFAHKTGEITGVVHDAGVFWVDGNLFCLVGMSCDLLDNTTGYQVLKEVGALVIDYLKEGKI